MEDYSEVEAFKQKQNEIYNGVKANQSEAPADDEQENETPKVTPLSLEEIKDKKGVPLSNRLAEQARKADALGSKLDEIMQQIQAFAGSQQNSQTARPADEAGSTNSYYIDDDYKAYVDAKFQQQEYQKLEKERETFIQKAHQEFPELMSSSESHDPAFLKKANEYLAKAFNQNNPEAPYLAAKMAAAEMGKLEKRARDKVLSDDSRRERILAEGSIDARGNADMDTEPKFNEKRLQKLLGVDPKKLKKRLKANAEKYKKSEGV